MKPGNPSGERLEITKSILAGETLVRTTPRLRDPSNLELANLIFQHRNGGGYHDRRRPAMQKNTS